MALTVADQLTVEVGIAEGVLVAVDAGVISVVRALPTLACSPDTLANRAR